MLGRPAPPIEGVSPSGEARSLSLVAGRSVVVFLTVGCAECAALWPELGTLASAARPAGRRLVVVTPGPGTESARRVAALVPAGVDEVVMGDGAWFAWHAAAAPWCVVVDDGVVRAEGTVRRPRELLALVGPVG